MRRYLWFSLMASVFFAGATGQTQDGVSARREKVVEENLHYLAVIKGRPSPGISLADQISNFPISDTLLVQEYL
jgi:hypothetical protein